jgi:hypothetical protein
MHNRNYLKVHIMKKLFYLFGIASVVFTLSSCEKSALNPAQMASGKAIPEEGGPALSVDTEVPINEGRVTIKIINDPLPIFNSEPTEPSSPGKELPGIFPRYEAVYMDLRSIRIHNATGWHELTTEAAIYELVGLQNETGATVVMGAAAPAGEIDQIQLVLGDGNAVGILGNNIPLLPKVISPELSTVSIHDASIRVRSTTEIVISVDPYTSVYKLMGNDYTGDDGYWFKPVIKVKSIRQTV